MQSQQRSLQVSDCVHGMVKPEQLVKILRQAVPMFHLGDAFGLRHHLGRQNRNGMGRFEC